MMYKCSLSQLSIEIGNVYRELHHLYSFDRYKVHEIQGAVLSNEYQFSPLRVKFIPSKDHTPTGAFHTIYLSPNKDKIAVVRPTEEDDMVLIALARMLNLTFLCLIDNSFGFRLTPKEFHKQWVSCDKMEFHLYRSYSFVDYISSFSTLIQT